MGPPPLREGVEPRSFFLRNLSVKDVRRMRRESDEEEMALLAARLAVVAIKGRQVPGFQLEVKDGISNLDAMPGGLYGTVLEVGVHVIRRLTPSGK